MLFSGGGTGASRPWKEEKKEKKFEKDDKYEVQEAVFIRWANSLFDDGKIQELKDMTELKFLSSFAELITGERIPPTGNRFDDVDTIFHALVAATATNSTRPREEVEKLLQLSIPGSIPVSPAEHTDTELRERATAMMAGVCDKIEHGEVKPVKAVRKRLRDPRASDEGVGVLLPDVEDEESEIERLEKEIPVDESRLLAKKRRLAKLKRHRRS